MDGPPTEEKSTVTEIRRSYEFIIKDDTEVSITCDFDVVLNEDRDGYYLVGDNQYRLASDTAALDEEAQREIETAILEDLKKANYPDDGDFVWDES